MALFSQEEIKKFISNTDATELFSLYKQALLRGRNECKWFLESCGTEIVGIMATTHGNALKKDIRAMIPTSEQIVTIMSSIAFLREVTELMVKKMEEGR